MPEGEGSGYKKKQNNMGVFFLHVMSKSRLKTQNKQKEKIVISTRSSPGG